MSRYFPHTPYAEDQPYSHLILSTHVLHRGFQAGALLGSTAGISYATYRYFRPSPPKPTPPTPSPSRRFRTTFRTTGLGALGGLTLVALALPGRMWGREEIEWQDRAWRLLENDGQLSIDDWSLGGMVAAVAAVALEVAAAARRGVFVGGSRPLALVGAAGFGSLAGTAGSVGWRAWRKEEGVGRGEAKAQQKRLLEDE